MVKIRQILLFIMFSFVTVAANAQNEVDVIVQTLQTANFSNLLPFWDEEVEVTLLDMVNQRQMTAKDANQQLQSFFNTKNIVGFEKNAERKVGNTIYVTGKLLSGQNKYSLTLLLQLEKKTLHIVSVRVS
ncbi:MAG: hypothetical protein RL064_31 [Bacteroidota bacterium]|jgi:hypothetical protein